MVSTRSRAAAAVVASPPTASTPAPSPLAAALPDYAYERRRNERIRENLARLQKLGIVDLALKLKPNRPAAPKRSLTKRQPVQLPARRSFRLQSVPSVSYSEVRPAEKRTREAVDLPEGPRDEVYTEAHDKLLGKYEEEWVLFVDGCGLDGKRIYDQVKGKTCHQCRQKTLGHRTSCCKCDLVQGQFCGDCLFMRYGENVLEANKNPDWVCPVCRGICNCSLCRVKKGWAPTGALYRKVKSLGFKSVAHYLIQTRRAETSAEAGEQELVSAKRSLKFADEESTLSGKSSVTANDLGSANEEEKPSEDCGESTSTGGS